MSNVISLSINGKILFIQELVDPFLNFMMAKGFSYHTIYRLRINIKLFFNWCNSAHIETINQLNSDIFNLYVAHLYERPNTRDNGKLSKLTISQHITFLRYLSRYLIDNHLAFEDYAKDIVYPKKSQTVIQAFTEEQIKLIFSTLTSFRSNKRTRIIKAAFLYLLLDTGLRITEGLYLKPSNIDFNRRLLIVNSKNKQREVPFSLKTSDLLQRIIQMNETDRDDYIWKSPRTGKPFTTSNFRDTLRKIKNKIGNRENMDAIRVSPHTFRHTFAKRWIMNGGDPFSLRKIMGHSNIETTMKYIHLWGDDLVRKHDECHKEIEIDDWMVYLKPKPRSYYYKKKEPSYEMKGLDPSGIPIIVIKE